MVRDEGHGFTQYENRVDMYRTMLAFLDRNIGAQRPASAGGPCALRSFEAIIARPASAGLLHGGGRVPGGSG